MDKRILFRTSLGGDPLGQTPTATVVGVVRDSSGAVVVGARVTAQDEGTNIAHEAVTGDEGGYTIPLPLPESTRKRRGAELPPDRAARDHSASRPEGAYRADAGARPDHGPDRGHRDAVLTETESASVGTVIDNQKVVDLPLNGRHSIRWLSWRRARFLRCRTQPTVSAADSTWRGRAKSRNNFTLDGITDNNGSINGPSFRPSIDAIGEFKLLTGVYPAEYGHNSGGQVVVTTKSGSNSLHGTAFDFLRNQVMDAKNYLRLPDRCPLSGEPVRRTLGGPVVHDKTFLFLSYEGFRLSQQSPPWRRCPPPT